MVHNYGHGGGGMTLSWGTADLAVQMAVESGAHAVRSLGAGGVGLATAQTPAAARHAGHDLREVAAA